jgi:hypothetical protein
MLSDVDRQVCSADVDPGDLAAAAEGAYRRAAADDDGLLSGPPYDGLGRE